MSYLYRGKTPKGKWVYGSLVVTTNYVKHMPKQHTKTWIVQSAFGNGGWFSIMKKSYVRPETVGQSTGERDMWGEEVFKGDILSIDDPKNYFIVDWQDGAFVLVGNHTTDKAYNIEYYQKEGNAHDNPELVPAEARL